MDPNKEPSVEKDTANRIRELFRYIREKERKDPQILHGSCDEAIALAMAEGDDLLLAEALLLKGRIFWLSSKLPEALDYLNRAHTALQNAPDAALESAVLCATGNVFIDMDMMEDSLKYYLRAKKLALSCNDVHMSAVICNNIGEVFKELGGYSEALDYYRGALEIDQTPPSEKFENIISIVLSNIGEVELIKGNLDMAEASLMEALAVGERCENYITVSHVCHFMGEICRLRGQYDEALEYLATSYEIFSSTKDYYNQILMLFTYSDVHREKGDPEAALNILLRADTLAREAPYLRMESRCYARLGQFFEEQNCTEEALKYYRAYRKASADEKKGIVEQRLKNLLDRFELERISTESYEFKISTELFREKSEALGNAYMRIAAISEIGRRITDTQDISDIVEIVYTSVLPLIKTESFVIVIIDDEERELVPILAVDNGVRVARNPYPVDSPVSLISWVYRNKREIFSGDIKSDIHKYADGYYERVSQAAENSVIFMPLEYADRVIGVVTIQSIAVNAYDKHHLELVRALGAYLTIAISNAKKALLLKAEIAERTKAQSELESANILLKHISERDGLTGVCNRRRVNDYLSELNSWLRESDIYVYIVDIDNFKNYNDTYGHLNGDEVLKDVASILKENFESCGGFLGRYGGEEFIGILTRINEEDALTMGSQILRAVESQGIVHEKSPHGVVTVSMGIALAKIPGDNVLNAVRAADEAMYAAKEAGRNCLILASEAGK